MSFSGTAALQAVRRVSFSTLGSLPQLFVDYCDGNVALDPYFAGSFASEADLRATAETVAAHPRDRAAVSAVLLDQNRRWGADAATLQNIDKLAHRDAVCVVTGQQLGLFGGPLYTLYKTITAIKLAERLARIADRPVIPVFWLEAEDHDFDEVRSHTFVSGGELRSVTLDQEVSGSVGRAVLDDAVQATLADLEENLEPTEYTSTVMEVLRAHYRPGVRMVDAFAGVITAWFAGTGLVLMTPDDTRLKAVASTLFAREIEDYSTSSELLAKVSEQLAVQYHAQVQVKPTNLFVFEGGVRCAIDATGGELEIRGVKKTSRRELLDRLQDSPGDFSPNVVLRPLMQDTLLPTAAYVGGPGEISYFAQYKPIYAWADVPMPIIQPRVSATLMPAAVEKHLKKSDLVFEELDETLETLFATVVQRQLLTGVDTHFDRTQEELEAALDHLRPTVERVDATLGKSVEAAKAAMRKEVDRLKGRVLKAEKRKHTEVEARLRRVLAYARPSGKLQERVLSPATFFNRHGFGLVATLMEALSMDTTSHQIIDL